MDRTTFFLFLALSLAACSSIPHSVQPPKVELASLDLRDPTLTATTLLFGVRVENPNSFSLPLGSVRYALNINGAELATGVTEDVGRISQNDKRVVEIPVRVTYSALYQSMKKAVNEGKLKYELKGSVSAVGLPVPFTLDGNLELPSMPFAD